MDTRMALYGGGSGRPLRDGRRQTGLGAHTGALSDYYFLSSSTESNQAKSITVS